VNGTVARVGQQAERNHKSEMGKRKAQNPKEN